jgi:hypothetical protein
MMTLERRNLLLRRLWLAVKGRIFPSTLWCIKHRVFGPTPRFVYLDYVFWLSYEPTTNMYLATGFCAVDVLPDDEVIVQRICPEHLVDYLMGRCDLTVLYDS